MQTKDAVQQERERPQCQEEPQENLKHKLQSRQGQSDGCTLCDRCSVPSPKRQHRGGGGSVGVAQEGGRAGGQVEQGACSGP